MNNLETVFGIINSVWRSSKLDPNDQGTARVWDMAILDLSTSTILIGCEALAKSEDKFAPNPGRFRRLCLDAQETKRQADLRAADQQAFAAAHERVKERTPEEAAWAATQRAFAGRVMSDPLGVATPNGRQRLNVMPKDGLGEMYRTDFDWRYVVESAPLPASSRYEDHREAFAELKVIFEREWFRREERAA